MGILKDARLYRQVCNRFNIGKDDVWDVVYAYTTAVHALSGGRITLEHPVTSELQIMDAVKKEYDATLVAVEHRPIVQVTDGKRKILCGVCGKGLPKNVSYCPQCGTKVEKVNET